MQVLAIGDIVGRPGRRAVGDFVKRLRKERGIDFVIANGENAAGGFGLTPDTADELFNNGVDVITSGNHIWAQRDLLPFLDGELPILRPLNYPPGAPGRGHLVIGQVMVVNLMGRTFMTAIDCPFRAMDRLLNEVKPLPPVIVVDFHAEATSEKVALGRYLDGRVSAVLGTHTHVGTIDTQVLAGGTAYVTDIGMTGPLDSVIGDDPASVLRRFLTGMPHQLSVGSGKPALNSILVEINPDTGRATSIERITRKVGESG